MNVVESVAWLHHEPVNYIQDTGHMAAAFSALPLDGPGANDATKDHRAVLCLNFNVRDVRQTKVQVVQNPAFQVSVFLRVARMSLVRADRSHDGPFFG
jgi:hypothetical protein